MKLISFVLLSTTCLWLSNASINREIFIQNLKFCVEAETGVKKVNYLDFAHGKLPGTTDEKCFLACMGEKYKIVSF